jgi:hypothetical protein
MRSGPLGGFARAKAPAPALRAHALCLEFANVEVTQGRPHKVPSAPAGGSHGAARGRVARPAACARPLTRNAQQASLQLGVKSSRHTTLSLALTRSRRAPVGACRTSSTRKRRHATESKIDGCRGASHLENVAPRASQRPPFFVETTKSALMPASAPGTMRARVAHDVGRHEGHAGELYVEQLEHLPLSHQRRARRHPHVGAGRARA